MAAAKRAAKAAEPVDPIPALVDELGDLEREMAPHQAKLGRIEDLRKKLRDLYSDRPANLEFEAHGVRFVALLGERGRQTFVNVDALAKRVKTKVLAALASVTLKALYAAELDPAIVAEVVETSQTGPRSLKILAKGPAQN